MAIVHTGTNKVVIMGVWRELTEATSGQALSAQGLSDHLSRLFETLAARPAPAHLVQLADELEAQVAASGAGRSMAGADA